jgi:dihydroorotate dehydrogenase
MNSGEKGEYFGLYLRGDMYKLLRTILFFFDAEKVHHFSMKALKLCCGWPLMRRLVTWSCQPEAGPAGSPETRGASGAEGGAAAAGMPAGSSALPGGSTARGGGAALQSAGLGREVFGLNFSNPVGLGAGFDKNALYLRELEALGFGFVEIGTVTPKPQAGNEQPRLFRLPQDQGLINRMGFNNEGVEVIAARLKSWRAGRGARPGQDVVSEGGPGQDAMGDGRQGRKAGGIKGQSGKLIIGGNIGKNKATPNETAWKDYEICFRVLYNLVDYFVVNVSSPNTPGLRELQEKEALHKILTNLQRINSELSVQLGIRPRPLLLKIAPDLHQQQLDDVVALALEIKLDGLVAANTTIGRSDLVTPAGRLEAIGAGGLSGAPLRERATEVVSYLCEKTSGRIPVIASGGIFTADDAREKLAVGAVLVQVWTGFIYEGPFIVRRICRGV